MTLENEWKKTKKLVREGYKILEKEFSINIPAPCLPAISPNKDTGIGSPQSEGAKEFFDFFDGLFHKALLGPTGRSFPPLYSPYESTYGYNPLFLNLEKLTTGEYGNLLSRKTLESIYNRKKKETEIDFVFVGRDYNKALQECYENFEKNLAKKQAFAVSLNRKIKLLEKEQSFLKDEALFFAPFNPHRYLFEEALGQLLETEDHIPYIADIEVKLPDSLVVQHPEWFLKGFTLGSPADAFANAPRNWHFKVFDPDFIFNKDGSLGPAGQFLFNTFDHFFKTYSGGVRIDHFIGFVNPFVISNQKDIPSGRLYSSPENPVLKKYAKTSTDEFTNIFQRIILPAMEENHHTLYDIYPEDLGNRPEQMDAVMEKCELGRMLVSQFVNPEKPDHIYRLKNANKKDIAVLDTHDTASVYDFFTHLSETEREKHARQLCQDLRFNYHPNLTSVKELTRMKWAELLLSPAERVQAFFTSFLGQDGRYNEPGNPKKWRLRCSYQFKELYFRNLLEGKAYNPLDAIALAIYARGEDFYHQNETFVQTLRSQEEILLNEIKSKYSF